MEGELANVKAQGGGSCLLVQGGTSAEEYGGLAEIDVKSRERAKRVKGVFELVDGVVVTPTEEHKIICKTNVKDNGVGTCWMEVEVGIQGVKIDHLGKKLHGKHKERAQ